MLKPATGENILHVKEQKQTNKQNQFDLLDFWRENNEFPVFKENNLSIQILIFDKYLLREISIFSKKQIWRESIARGSAP